MAAKRSLLRSDARGMTTRDIQAHLEELYQVEVSPAAGCARLALRPDCRSSK
jgi:transposase-like protein